METMELTPLSEIVDKVWGKKGTPERDAMEVQLKEELNTYYVGEAIKEDRYWSSTEDSAYNAWNVNIAYGYVNFNPKSNMYHVRPVSAFSL